MRFNSPPQQRQTPFLQLQGIRLMSWAMVPLGEVNWRDSSSSSSWLSPWLKVANWWVASRTKSFSKSNFSSLAKRSKFTKVPTKEQIKSDVKLHKLVKVWMKCDYFSKSFLSLILLTICILKNLNFQFIAPSFLENLKKVPINRQFVCFVNFLIFCQFFR